MQQDNKRIFGMLLGTSGASLLVNMLAGKGLNRAGDRAIQTRKG